jgi:hypothetical protein
MGARRPEILPLEHSWCDDFLHLFPPTSALRKLQFNIYLRDYSRNSQPTGKLYPLELKRLEGFSVLKTHLTCFEFVLRTGDERDMAKLDVEQATKEMTRVAEAVLSEKVRMTSVRELIPENAVFPCPY